jgi:hypothetical protein
VGQWKFNPSIKKIENKDEFTELATLLDQDDNEIGDFFLDNQWVQPDETQQDYYILGKNIYKISVNGDSVTAVKQAPGYI